MNTFGSLFSRSALIWKKSEQKVFNWSEFHFSEVTSYKIHTLEKLMTYKMTKKSRQKWFQKVIEKIHLYISSFLSYET